MRAHSIMQTWHAASDVSYPQISIKLSYDCHAVYCTYNPTLSSIELSWHAA